ncbi:MAG: MerR family transcriptional regulator, partial [Alphaproteobacteria bacterium]|nr:MerR family transcriptional regulator [Alphaproteobacteria bacterium]
MVPASAPAPVYARSRPLKSASAFRTISEVADHLDVPQHVLRFWETRFTQIRPLKRAGGRRYYRPEDVDLLRRIRELLYRDGYTIKGVQKLLRDNGRDHGDATEEVEDAEPSGAASAVASDM